MSKFNVDTQNTKFNLVFLGIIVLLLLSLTNNLFSTFINEDSKYLKKEIIKIEKQINEYQLENKKIIEKNKELEKAIIKVDSNISRNNKNIDKLKIKTNEKINNFKSYDARMWEEFFANRYKK